MNKIIFFVIIIIMLLAGGFCYDKFIGKPQWLGTLEAIPIDGPTNWKATKFFVFEVKDNRVTSPCQLEENVQTGVLRLKR